MTDIRTDRQADRPDMEPDRVKHAADIETDMRETNIQAHRKIDVRAK